MSLLKCSDCEIEFFGLSGDRCISCDGVAYVVRENPSLDSVREQARSIPINNRDIVDYLMDIFEEK